MVIKKSQDELKLITALLRDVQTLRCEVFTARSLRLTTQKVAKRYDREGISFLTKTLPRLGKALDRALSGEVILDAEACAFKSMRGSKLPMFMGELFELVFSHDGQVLPNACTASIKQLRQICYLFYKYKLPYTAKQEQKVIASFIETEDDILSYDKLFNRIADKFNHASDEFARAHSLHSTSSGTSLGCDNVNSPSDSQDPYALPSVTAAILSGGIQIKSPNKDPMRTAGIYQRVARDISLRRSESEGVQTLFYDAFRDGLWEHMQEEQVGEDPLFGPHYEERFEQMYSTVIRARRLLNKVFESFDPTDIHPRHGPGAVSTREKLWAKFTWTNVPERIAAVYPIDAYFYASLGHVCDAAKEINSLGSAERPARVILVPKDSRGPRLISCEPLENQWVQQGLGRAIVKHVERIPLTKWNVNFTNQQPNQFGALLGSVTGAYATLDLKEASDRVSVGLVRLLFPEKVLPYLMACRSLATELPNGEKLTLRKYAPMGSALCFPVLALTTWALLTAATPDADACEGILVYGDDVIVPTAKAANAIEQLELFGLKVNRSKSCVSGFFRESCGMDAYKGTPVTPLRFRNVWPSRRDPNALTAWTAYANSMWDERYLNVYEVITEQLFSLFGSIPDDGMQLSCPSLRQVPADKIPKRSRTNKSLQKREYQVWDVKAVKTMKTIDGWRMLLRYFSECSQDAPLSSLRDLATTLGEKPICVDPTVIETLPRSILSSYVVVDDPEYRSIGPGVIKVSYHDNPSIMSVSSYTRRRATKVVRRWC